MWLVDILRFAGFVLLTVIPKGLAKECTDSSDCVNSGQGTCCGMDGVCSAGGTLPYAADATDACQCEDNVLADGQGICGCSEDSQCVGLFAEVCCKEQGLCQLHEERSLPVGAFGMTSCECESHVKPVGSTSCAVCTADRDCFSEETCYPTGICKSEDSGGSSSASVDSGGSSSASVASDGFTNASGDAHMTRFLGQRLDFAGVDGLWYALVSDPPRMHLNIRVTAPVAALPMITYITGISLLATDLDGSEHNIVISVKEPHSMDSTCPTEHPLCLADGSLAVVVDGEEAFAAPGKVTMGPGIQVTAVNIPGECSSLFETYWVAKKQESTQAGLMLSETLSIGEWILAHPTASNTVECMEYVTRSLTNEGGLFVDKSVHASFQILTPAATIGISHGRLHHSATTQGPTDQLDLPDPSTWQMNVTIDHTDLSYDAKGVLGETFVSAGEAGGDIMVDGMQAVRGEQKDYAVQGPLGMTFALDGRAS